MARSESAVTNGNQATVANSKQCVTSSNVAVTHSNGAQAVETTDVTNGNQKTLTETVTNGKRDDAITINVEDAEQTDARMMSNTNTNNNQQVLTAVTHGNGNVVTLATSGQSLPERETLLALSLSSCSSGSEGKNCASDRSGRRHWRTPPATGFVMPWCTERWESYVPLVVYSSQNERSGICGVHSAGER